MSEQTGIEWTDSTWNPVTGCTKISPGCKYCYADRLAPRLKAMGNRRYVNGFEITPPPRPGRTPKAVEETKENIRQFHERLVPRGYPIRFHPIRIQHD